MWYPVKLKIVNLFSYQESEIDFTSRKGRLTCINGSNQTDPKTLSNGSGKTSLLDCITIALTGSPLRQISKKDIVRNGYNSGYLEFSLRNDVLNKELLIKESVDKVKSNKVEVWENGILNDQLKDLSPKDAHKYILSLIDVSEDDLLNYYLLSKDTYTSFFKAKDANKKEVINRFSKANVIDPIDEFIKKDLLQVEQEIIKIDQKIVSNASKVELLTDQIESLKSIDNEEIKNKEIEKIELRIVECSDRTDVLNEDIVQLELGSKKVIDEITQLGTINGEPYNRELVEVSEKRLVLNNELILERKTFSSIDEKYNSEIDKVDGDIKVCDAKITTLLKSKRDIANSISEIEIKIADEIECPSCHHKFSLKDKEYSLDEAKEALIDLRKKETEAQKLIDEWRKDIDSYKDVKKEILENKAKEQERSVSNIKVINSQILDLDVREKNIKAQQDLYNSKLNHLKNSLPRFDSEIEMKKNKIRLFEEEIKELLEKIDKIEKREEEDKITPLVKQIDEINTVKESLLIERELVVKNKESLSSWRLRFKKFKSYLANNSIGMIESLSNSYLQGMHTHLSVAIDGFREKADGSLKEEITTEVSRDGGVSSENFYKFSGGEKSKIDVAGILSMQKLINLNSKSGGLDLLLIDEIIDAIDRVALSELISSLDKIGQTILLISHIDLPDTENAINVEKKLGISNIISN